MKMEQISDSDVSESLQTTTAFIPDTTSTVKKKKKKHKSDRSIAKLCALNDSNGETEEDSRVDQTSFVDVQNTPKVKKKKHKKHRLDNDVYNKITAVEEKVDDEIEKWSHLNGENKPSTSRKSKNFHDEEDVNFHKPKSKKSKTHHKLIEENATFGSKSQQENILSKFEDEGLTKANYENSVFSSDQPIFFVKISKDIDPSSLVDKKLTLDAEKKVKIDGQKYSSTPVSCDDTFVVLCGNKQQRLRSLGALQIQLSLEETEVLDVSCKDELNKMSYRLPEKPNTSKLDESQNQVDIAQHIKEKLNTADEVYEAHKLKMKEIKKNIDALPEDDKEAIFEYLKESINKKSKKKVKKEKGKVIEEAENVADFQTGNISEDDMSFLSQTQRQYADTCGPSEETPKKKKKKKKKELD